MGITIMEMQVMWLIGLVLFYLVPIGIVCTVKNIETWERIGWILLIVFFSVLGFAAFMIVHSSKKINSTSKRGDNHVDSSS